jgi:hypothetical protein
MQSQLQRRCAICISSSHPHHHHQTNRSQNTLFNRRPRYNASYNQITIRSILLFGHNREEEYRRPWHDPDFMKNDAPDQVEAWLLSLLKSSNNNIEKDTSYSPNRPPVSLQNNDKFMVDSTAYLRVLDAYASMKNYSGAPQKVSIASNSCIGSLWIIYRLVDVSYKLLTTSETYHPPNLTTGRILVE